ncbi:hypothetical protein D7Y27_41500 [Corallococcus sp. AB004]|uniref:hypothetical protein n=1 Tax=Corallococcus exiguus TaxID=83462 RepID=UPI000EA08460|nr:hypothetical protein [Corallococcus exiguus]NPC75871.1 hypothetical protein [Corallococcus exiguus]NPD29680.1 hypothetical protein [Corallococcus exiguus]RKI27227.1 hypothetical protein D7Y27_41500 [Corallococcus sp. AB004]
MFRQLGTTCFLAAALATSACKSKTQDPASAPTPPASPPAQASPTAAPPPVSNDTLSFAQSEGDTCKWVRFEGRRNTRRTLFSFLGGCDLAQFSWSLDGREGTVLQSFKDQRVPRAWLVDLVAGQGTPLPLPGVGRTDELGFDPEGRPVALVAHYDSPPMKPPERAEKEGQRVLVFEGAQYPVDSEGESGLAHAYRLSGDKWTRVETRVAEYGSDLSEGTHVLELARKLGPSTKRASNDDLRPEAVSDEEQTALDASAEMDLIGPRGEDLLGESNWVRSNLSGGAIYYRAEPVEVANASSPLRWNAGGKFVEPEKLTLPGGTDLSLMSRGGVLLVTAGKTVRLYDVNQRKLLGSLDGVSLTSFWPRAEKPGTQRLKLDDSRVALDFIEKSGMALAATGESCSQLKEAGTLGALVKKARVDYREWFVQCDTHDGPQTWSCQARFMTPGDEENPDGPAMRLEYRVQDATQSILPESLVCQLAG